MAGYVDYSREELLLLLLLLDLLDFCCVMVTEEGSGIRESLGVRSRQR